eukprot:TRINITY_DN2716_c0_g1_i1.p1 TRINITY_DN2716_c0_g1~~TRINITY_DN2716_c0_g1_i1.p1  ORF type:complete len:305 (+),score=70.49 TRINITY_DN2716_c0_g1_i1:37-951(+)
MKPMPCKYWRPHERGSCRNGETCPFLHAPPQDLPCKYYAAGHCRDGATCRFLHRSGEERKATACWEYSAGAGWRPFPASIVSKLEQAFQAGDRSVKYDIGGSCYELNLTDMKQCNLKDPGQRRRRVRRVVGDSRDDAMEEVRKWEGQIDEAQAILQRAAVFDAEQLPHALLLVADVLTEAATGLDGLQLSGDAREQRRVLLQRLESLEADLATKGAGGKEEAASGASTAAPELGASTLALVKEADEAMDKCEEDITDVQDMLGKFDTSDYLAAQNRIRMLEDLLFKIAETLDCLSLVGPQRARR